MVNDFKLIRPIGKGSYGEVFLAEYKKMRVAAKKADESLRDEIEMLTKLPPHVNVVQMLGTVHDIPSHTDYLIMEFCDGGSLDNIIYSNDHVDMAVRMKWLIEVATGLHHLHENQIVHRDIAARNILIDRGRAKITDLGLARHTKSVGMTKADIGPIRWMAPESFAKEYSTASDVWMFGILIYEVVERKEPHVTEEDTLNLATRIRNTGYYPEPVHISWRPILKEVYESCCAFSANKRPQIREVLDKLRSHYDKVYGETS